MKVRILTIILILFGFLAISNTGFGCGSAPVAILDAVPTDPNVNETVTLDGSDSYDTGGTIVKYEWDFDGDDTYDYNEISGSAGDGDFDGITTHTYDTSGQYTAKLRVTDDSSETGDDTCVVNVSIPVAVLNAEPTNVMVNETVTLDGSDSYDDGTIVKYEWDFDGDDTYDYNETSSSAGDGTFDGNTTHVYTAPGQYTAKLRVTDDDDVTDMDACYVYVDYAAKNVDQNSWYGTIQAAIDYANSGDVIQITSETHYETIDFNGVSCTLTSTDANDWDVVAAAIIDGNDSNGAVVTFDSGESNSSILKGITITGSEYGISCSNSSSPAITNCVIEDNNSYGIYCTSGSPDIAGNKIRENGVSGIYSSSTTPPAITNNWIYDNGKGAEFSSASSAATVRNNTIVDNTGQGIYVSSGTAPAITNCIFWANDGNDLEGCSATYSCIQDGSCSSGTGNINSYAYFEDFDANDFHLTWNSPCINRGDPNFTDGNEADIDGDSRVVDGRVDMGADELFDNDIHNSVNLIQNPGFEDGNDAGGDPLYWTSVTVDESEVDSNEAHSGNYSWRIYDDQTHPLPSGYSSYISAKPGDMFKLSAWIKTDETVTSILFCSQHDSNYTPLQQNGVNSSLKQDDWTELVTGVLVSNADTDYVKVKLVGPYHTTGTIWWDDVSLVKIATEYLSPYGCANEQDIVESIDFGGGSGSNESWVKGTITTYMSDAATDSNDNNITYRELLANRTVEIEFPPFNVDPNYDPNDPNDPNGFPLTPMLLEVMFKDTVDDCTTGDEASRSNLVYVISKIDYLDFDPNYIWPPSVSWLKSMLVHLGGVNDGNWKYAQYGFQITDFTLLRALDGKFTMKITNNTDSSMPIDYVSLRKITQAEYEALTDRQREVRGSYEIYLPADEPNNPSYDDPNITVFVRDIMQPVYKHTKPGPNEPNSITAFGCWGQMEPISFSIYSENGVSDVSVSVSDLTCASDSNFVIEDSNIAIYQVIYDESTLGHTMPRGYAFLPDRLKEFTTLSVDANTSERIWLKIQVPDEDANLTAGLYEGQINIVRSGEPNVVIPIVFTIYDITLAESKHANPVFHDPYTYRIYSTDSGKVFDAYSETGFDPFLFASKYRIDPETVNDIIVFDSNNFELYLDRMITEDFAKDTVFVDVGELGGGLRLVYKEVYDGNSLDTTDPNLYYKLSDPNFAEAYGNLINKYVEVANDRDINLIFFLQDDVGVVPYRRIIVDRLCTIIHDSNYVDSSVPIMTTYTTPCDEEVDVNVAPYYYNTPNNMNLPALTDIVDYKGWYLSQNGYAKFQDPNYYGYFGYGTTGHSHFRNPIYNRFLHGLFAFRTDAKFVGAYAMGDIVGDAYNDFDAAAENIFPAASHDYLYAYPTWSGDLLYMIGGLEGIREGIKDAKYIATLQNILDDPNTDWNDANVVDANGYLADLKGSIDPNYTNYYTEATELGYYKTILENVSDSNDPNDFEAFADIRKTLADFIITIKPD